MLGHNFNKFIAQKKTLLLFCQRNRSIEINKHYSKPEKSIQRIKKYTLERRSIGERDYCGRRIDTKDGNKHINIVSLTVIG